jgi:hypothetical protein
VDQNIERLLLHRVRRIAAIGAAVDVGIAVVGVVEGDPGRVPAGLEHPLVGELEDALQVVAVAPDVQNRRGDAPDALHRSSLVGVAARELDVAVLDLPVLARHGGAGIHAQEFV